MPVSSRSYSRSRSPNSYTTRSFTGPLSGFYPEANTPGIQVFAAPESSGATLERDPSQYTQGAAAESMPRAAYTAPVEHPVPEEETTDLSSSFQGTSFPGD